MGCNPSAEGQSRSLAKNTYSHPELLLPGPCPESEATRFDGSTENPQRLGAGGSPAAPPLTCHEDAERPTELAEHFVL